MNDGGGFPFLCSAKEKGQKKRRREGKIPFSPLPGPILIETAKRDCCPSWISPGTGTEKGR